MISLLPSTPRKIFDKNEGGVAVSWFGPTLILSFVGLCQTFTSSKCLRSGGVEP